MNGLTFFGDGDINDIRSVGLVFGPNFFIAYFYSDYDGQKPLAYKRGNLDETEEFSSLANYNPIFAHTFNTDWTLMPQAVFEEKDAKTILKFNTSADGAEAKWNRIIGLDAVICSEPDKTVTDRVNEIFPGLDLRHGVGALLEYCRKVNKSNEHVFLHEAEGRFTLVVFDGDKLLLANSFDGKFDEDVRYFVLYSLKQLKIETTAAFTFLGDVVANKSVLDMLGPYLHNIQSPLLSDSPAQEIAQSENDQHWIGLNAVLCAL